MAIPLRQQMRDWLLSLGYGARVTARDLYKKYGELGGALNADGSCNSTMYKLQHELPLVRTPESHKATQGAGFSVRLVFIVDEEEENKLRAEEERKRKPKKIWDALAESVKTDAS